MSLVLEGNPRADGTRPQLFVGGMAAAANAEVLDQCGVALLVAAAPHAQKGWCRRRGVCVERLPRFCDQLRGGSSRFAVEGARKDGHDVSPLCVDGSYTLVFLRSVQTACQR